MAGDGLSDAQAIQFWEKSKIVLGDTVPKVILETCEVALIGGALNVAHRLSESFLVQILYYGLLLSFAMRIAARIGIPTKYDSPMLPILAGLAVTGGLTYVEDRAIQSVASATLLQMQSDKAVKFLEAQAFKKREDIRFMNEWGEKCADGKPTKACDDLMRKWDALDNLTVSLRQP